MARRHLWHDLLSIFSAAPVVLLVRALNAALLTP